MQATTQITRDKDRVYRLQIKGRLAPLWAGDLATGLAALRVQIISARGKGVGLDWEAEFLLDFGGSHVVPESIDYLTLAITKQSTAFTAAPGITRFTCARLPNQMLEVRVYGPDQPGLLSRLLGRLGALLLFLSEFDINTRVDQVEDRFVLVGMGGLAPSVEVQTALEKMLRSLCKPEASPTPRH